MSCSTPIPWVLALVLTATSALADDAFQPQFLPTLHVERTNATIVVDGDLGDPGWRGAARATGFAEVSPGDQVEPPVHSEAWVTYDETSLYIALIAHDDPEDIRFSVSDRDDIYRDDYFGVMLDTYGDQRWGYELFVNPLGIQGDVRMQSNGGEDGSFDIIWYSEGRLTERGYQVEIAIPFASLRFPDRPEQTWRVNFWRDRQRDVRRKFGWAAEDRDNPCFLCQWGTLTGIENIEPGQNLELIATAIGTQAGSLEDRTDPTSRFDSQSPDADAALNARYGITSSSSAELALNPDFSQVESDAGRIDINTTFALFFPERRPFFQEGSNLYNTWIDAIYTRSINDPNVAGKLTGQFGKTSVIYTFAQDDRSPLILPFEERSRSLLLDDSVSNIVRVQRSLREESYVGALFTDRRISNSRGAGTTWGVDGLWRFFRNYRLELQAVGSRTREPNDPASAGELEGTFDSGRHTVALDGEDFTGHATYVSLERSARTWNADFDYWEYSPTFRTDNGFTTRNDYRQTSFWTGPFFRPNGNLVVNWEPSVGIGRVWNTEGRFKDEWIRPNLYLRLKGQTDVTLQYLFSRERFGEAGEVFPGIRIGLVEVDTKFSELVGAGVFVRVGRGLFRDRSAPELADQFDFSADLRLKPSQRFKLETDFDFSRMKSRVDGKRLFSGYILRNRLTYNFSREWFLRLIVQYDDFRDRLDFEPLLTYRINPFTVFYLGSSSRLQRFAGEEFDPIRDTEWRTSSRQFFAKVQYLFRM